jgi:membrane-associated phospholipid phosphatase
LFLKKFFGIVFLFATTGAVALQPLDLTLVLAGSSLAGAGLLAASGVPPVSDDERTALQTRDLSPVDRALIFPDNPLLGTVSDLVAYSQALVPIGAAAVGLRTQNAQDLLARHFQVLSITYGTSYLLKAAFWRARPFLYFPEVPANRALDPGGANSFPSSHVAIAFASAAFISTVANDYWAPGYTTLLTVASYSMASMSAILRIASGRHFVSDVLAGALIGVLIGWGIPTAHALSETKPDS